MAPPASAVCSGVRSLTSTGAGGPILSGFGVDAGTVFLDLASGFLLGDLEDFEVVLRWGGSTTTPSGPTGSRSSSTTAEGAVDCHSSMAPSRVGAARN